MASMELVSEKGLYRNQCQQKDCTTGTSVRKSTVQKYVKAGIVGDSPMKKGLDGGVPKDTY